MFCDTQLAARLEAAERDLTAAVAAGVRVRVPDALVQPIAGGLAVHSEPGAPCDKIIGLGFAPFDEAAWAELEALHQARGAPMQVELSTLADPAVGAFLTGRGFRWVGVENVLGCALPAAVAPTPRGIAVAASGRDEFEHWLDVVTTGFLHVDAQGVPSHESFARAAIERAVRDMASAPGFVRFLARCDGLVAAAASMRLGDGIAQLTGAATLPAHRRRGAQSALLTHRLGVAAALGATHAVMTALPGSKSMQNALRAGFALLYARVVLRREP